MTEKKIGIRIFTVEGECSVHLMSSETLAGLLSACETGSVFSIRDGKYTCFISTRHITRMLQWTVGDE